MNILGIIEIADWFLVVIVLAVLFYIFTTSNHGRFKEQGIPGPKPYPILGTGFEMFTKGLIDVEKDRYKKYGPLYGTFMGNSPQFVVARDDLLREILVKQFDAFSNRRSFTDGTEIVDNFLTVLAGDDWKRVRNLMTPTFSSGKLKLMMSMMNKCGKSLAENISQATKTTGAAFETKELSGCYTMDVIGATSFGVEVDSLKNPDNDFVKNAKRIFDISLFSPFLIINLFFPFLEGTAKKMGMRIFPKDAIGFFEQVTKQAMETKKSTSGGNTDLLQLMLNAQNLEITEEQRRENEEFGATYEKNAAKGGLKMSEITANGVLVFLAGYDTTATLMSLLLYTLAIEQEIQEKLFQEIQDVAGDKDNVDYNDITKMPYLDMCVSETLRVYPPAPMFDRVCEKDITIEGVHFKKGDFIIIPSVALHFDEKRWPNPEVFDPERFTPEEKKMRGPFDWMPFGYGPRNCIGMRLALLEAKVAVVQVLKKQKLVTCEKTKVPLTFDKLAFKVKEGIWISAVPRD